MRILKSLQSKLKSKFIKQFMTLLSGSVIGELILFLVMPLLTRLYPEELFGLFFIYASLSGVMRVIAGLRMEMALVLPEKDSHAINLLALGFVFNLLINIFLFFCISIFYDFINRISGSDSLGFWLYILPVSSFLLAGFELFSAWSNRTEKYKYISAGKISKSIGTGGSQAAFAAAGRLNSGLFFGVIIGQFASFAVIFYLNSKSLVKNLKYMSVRRSLALLRKYRDIPVFNTLLSIVSVVSGQLPLLFLGFYFGAEVAGLFGLAMRIAGPANMISDAVGRVFFKKSSDIANEDADLYSFVKKVVLNLSKISVFIFSLVFFVSFFLEEIFGEGWEKAGIYTRLLIPWLMLRFAAAPVSWIITVVNKQKALFIINIILTVMRVGVILLSRFLGLSSKLAVFAFSMVGAVYSLFLIVYIFKISKQVKGRYWRKK